MNVTIDEKTQETIIDILSRRKTAIVYCSRKGLVVAEQSSKIKNLNPDVAIKD